MTWETELNCSTKRCRRNRLKVSVLLGEGLSFILFFLCAPLKLQKRSLLCKQRIWIVSSYYSYLSSFRWQESPTSSFGFKPSSSLESGSPNTLNLNVLFKRLPISFSGSRIERPSKIRWCFGRSWQTGIKRRSECRTLSLRSNLSPRLQNSVQDKRAVSLTIVSCTSQSFNAGARIHRWRSLFDFGSWMIWVSVKERNFGSRKAGLKTA